MQTRFAIITPVYEDKAAATRLLAELSREFASAPYMVVVDDGSVREPVEHSWLTEAGLEGCVITLARNAGHQRALAVGLSYATEHLPDMPVVTMDSDGEDVPATIRQLLAAMDGQTDIAVAQRKSRVETLKFKFFYAIYKRVFRLLSGRAISFGNFALYTPNAVSRLSKMAEPWLHLAAAVLSSRLRIAYVPIDRGPRYAGKSKMNFVSLVLHGFRGLMVFAEDVLVRVGIFCGMIVALAGAGIALAIFFKIVGMSTPGWFSMIVGVLLVIMFQTGLLTLTTLLLTGVMKAVLNTPPDYRFFIKSVSPAHALKPQVK